MTFDIKADVLPVGITSLSILIQRIIDRIEVGPMISLVFFCEVAHMFIRTNNYGSVVMLDNTVTVKEAGGFKKQHR